MKNVELLQATGIKDICIVNYQLTDDQRVRELEAVLQKCGFRVIGLRKGYYSDGEDALVMAKDWSETVS